VRISTGKRPAGQKISDRITLFAAPPRPLQPLRVGFGFLNGTALALSPIFGVSMAVRASAAASPTAPKRFNLGSPPLVRIWGC
jgi:hypothetical protein